MGDEAHFSMGENKMTRYEELTIKANRCLNCAKNTTGRMREIWIAHYRALTNKALSLTVSEAKMEVKKQVKKNLKIN